MELAGNHSVPSCAQLGVVRALKPRRGEKEHGFSDLGGAKRSPNMFFYVYFYDMSDRNKNKDAGC